MEQRGRDSRLEVQVLRERLPPEGCSCQTMEHYFEAHDDAACSECSLEWALTRRGHITMPRESSGVRMDRTSTLMPYLESCAMLSRQSTSREVKTQAPKTSETLPIARLNSLVIVFWPLTISRDNPSISSSLASPCSAAFAIPSFSTRLHATKL